MVNILLVLVLQTQVTGSDVTGSISGHVRSNTGQPLPGVVSIGVATQSRADSLGNYQLDKVPAGVVHVMAWAYGYQVAKRDVLVEGKKTVTVDFFLDTMPTGMIPAGSVFGVVRDTAGHPMPSAIVIIRSEHHAVTDSLGRYRIDSVPLGATQLWVRRLGYTDAPVDTVVTVREFERDLVLRRAPPLLPSIAR